MDFIIFFFFVVKLLIKYRATLQTTKNGWNPLHIACYYGYSDILLFLLDSENLPKNTINQKDNLGRFCDEEKKKKNSKMIGRILIVSQKI